MTDGSFGLGIALAVAGASMIIALEITELISNRKPEAKE